MQTDDEITAEAVAAMTDTEIAMHASGSYGPRKRRLMIECIRRMAAGAKTGSETPGPLAA